MTDVGQLLKRAPMAAVLVYHDEDAVAIRVAGLEAQRSRLRPCLYRRLLAQARTCARAVRIREASDTYRWTFEYRDTTP